MLSLGPISIQYLLIVAEGQTSTNWRERQI